MNPKERLLLSGALVVGTSLLGGCDSVNSSNVEAAPKNLSLGDFAITLPTANVPENKRQGNFSQTPIFNEEETESRFFNLDGKERLIADTFIMPLEGGVARGWEFLEDVSSEGEEKRFHAGIDINWPGRIHDLTTFTGNEDFGMPALSISDGLCVYAKDSEGEYGNVVIMEYLLVNERGEEEKIYSLYAHLNEIMAEEGEVYRLGEEIGTVGRSGGVEFSHLHWEIFNEQHFNFILDNGIRGFWYDKGYIESNHQNPLVFLEAHK